MAAGTLPGRHLRKLMEDCGKGGLNLKIIRSVEDRLSGDERVPLRDIEINDLLGRDPVTLDAENIGQAQQAVEDAASRAGLQNSEPL